MLPLEILLSSIDIGVDRIGRRLPLQGRCASYWIWIPSTFICACCSVLLYSFVFVMSTYEAKTGNVSNLMSQ